MNNLLITNGTLITLGAKNRVINSGAVYIEDGKIAAVGTEDVLIKQYPKAERLDAQGKVIMPGMINTHHHLYSTMARGMTPPGEPAENFVQILERLWWKLDYALNEDDVYYSAIMPLIECIKNGTTTIIDHHASPSCRDGSLDIIEKAVLQAGLRACLCYEVSDRNIKGGGVKENVRFIRKCNSSQQNQISAMMGLHASMTISPETLNTCVGYARDLNVGCHIHVAEDKADREDSQQKYGVPTVTRLIQANAGGEKSIFVHCIHIDENEMNQLADSKTIVVHNPESNMNNAVGVAPVLDMMKKGILVGLGTDGMSSNMFSQARVAYLLHRLAKKDPRVAFVEAPQMLLWNNATIVNRLFPVTLGELTVGAAADIILVDYTPPTQFTADNFLGHFIFGLYDAQVNTTICNGRILMKDKKIQHLDVEKLAAKSVVLAKVMWGRL